MPSVRDVNAALSAYNNATKETLAERQDLLIRSLEHYAKRIVSMTLRRDDPEIVNEAVATVFAQLGAFRGESKFSSWVFPIVERICYRELRLKISRNETLFSE